MHSKLDINTTFSPTADAIESRLGDETVILHFGSGTYFGLDAVGTLVWERLGHPSGATLEAVCAYVRSSFANAPPTVEEDVSAFLMQLFNHGLIKSC